MYLHSCYFLFFHCNSLRSPICQTYAQLVFFHGPSTHIPDLPTLVHPGCVSHHAFSLRFGVVTLRWHLQCLVLVAYTCLARPAHWSLVYTTIWVSTRFRCRFSAVLIGGPRCLLLSDRAKHTSNHWFLLCTSLHYGPQTVLLSAISQSNSLPCAISCYTLGLKSFFTPGDTP